MKTISLSAENQIKLNADKRMSMNARHGHGESRQNTFRAQAYGSIWPCTSHTHTETDVFN